MAMIEDRRDIGADTKSDNVLGGGQSEPPITATGNWRVTVRSCGSEEQAIKLGNVVVECVREISRFIDLSTLDGVTVAYDYHQALLDLDRGFEASKKLTPSQDIATGIAMTPAVMRDGRTKSHIVLGAHYFAPLTDPDSDGFGLALHALAHECAHVEARHRFDACFPGVLLRKECEDARDSVRWQVIGACWDEYVVTQMVASIGQDPLGGYEETFLCALKETRGKADAFIQAFRTHRDVIQVVGEVYGAYGELMRFASYLLGTMASRQLTLSDVPRTAAALDGHWFSHYFERLGTTLSAIAAEYGRWNDLKAFEAIGNLAEQIAAVGGVIFAYRPDGQLYVDIPYRADTMPDDAMIRPQPSAVDK